MATERFKSQVLDILFARETSSAVRAAALAKTAREGLAELITSGRASPTYKTYVDGREGASEDQVSGESGATILYRFSYWAEIVVFAIAFLRERSPVGSGPGPRYRDSFIVAVNGREFTPDQIVPGAIPSDAEIMVFNSQPYSRKVDVQLIGSRVLKYSVKNDIIRDCALAVRRRFGNIVTAERIYTIDYPDRWVIRRGKDKGRLVEYPALVLNLR